ncbi:MAG: HAMP domain-containing sensor histidine kinase [bacterium]
MSGSSRLEKPARSLGFALWLAIGFAAVTVVSISSVGMLASLGGRETQLALDETREVSYLRQVSAMVQMTYGIGPSWERVEPVLVDLTSAMPGPMGRSRRLQVRDVSGRIVADATDAPPGREPPPVRRLLSLRYQGEVVGSLFGTMPALSPDQLIQLESAPVAMTGPMPIDPQTNMNRALLGGAGLGAFAALLVGAIFMHPLTTGVSALRAGAQRIAAGELGARVKPSGFAELAELAGSFNQLAESLDRQEEARRRLVADIAHDLRTPLTVISGTVEAMLDGIYDPNDHVHLRSVRDEAGRLARMVNDLRALSLADAGQMRLDLVVVPASSVIEDACDRFATRAADCAVALEPSITPGLPNVRIDPVRFAQVLGNLIENALRFTPSGGTIMLGAHLMVRADAQGALGVAMSVSDTGPGIPSEALLHIFDRFYRVDQARSPGGSGLGLAIVRTLVEAHNGTVAVANRPGSGAVFTVWLPIA